MTMFIAQLLTDLVFAGTSLAVVAVLMHSFRRFGGVLAALTAEVTAGPKLIGVRHTARSTGIWPQGVMLGGTVHHPRFGVNSGDRAIAADQADGLRAAA